MVIENDERFREGGEYPIPSSTHKNIYPTREKNDGFNKSNPPIKVALEQATKVVEDVIVEEAEAAFERETLTTSHS
jgi:hypothetical protein